jgi:hypothetical protein
VVTTELTSFNRVRYRRLLIWKQVAGCPTIRVSNLSVKNVRVAVLRASD